MRSNPMRLLVIALGALLLAPGMPLAAKPRAPPAARRLAIVPFYAPELMWRLYAPLVEYLSRQTGEAWTLVLPATHEAFDAAVCGGEVDVALMGPIPLARNHRRCGVRPFLVPLGQDGMPVYHAMLVTAAADVGSLADLRGRQIAFFRGSTAAHLVPVMMLQEAGLGPDAYQPLFLESQDRVMTAVLGGKASAGAVKSALYRRFAKERALKLLQTSRPLPNFAFASLPSLPKAVADHFSAALLRLRPREVPGDAEVVRAWDDELKAGFVAAPPGFLDAASDLLKTTESLRRAAE
jgi:ABC-type phosphate/phosphonate transport system substrate-binding protein